MYDIHCTILGWLDWNTLNYYCIWDLQFVGYDIMPIACHRWICAGRDTRFVGAVLRISLSFLSGLRPGGAWYIAGGLDKRQKRDLRGKKFRQMTCRVMKRFGRTEQRLTSCIFILFCLSAFALWNCLLLGASQTVISCLNTKSVNCDLID